MAEFKNELILQTVDSSGAVTKSVVVDLRNALVLTSAPTTATAARVGMQAYVVSGSTVKSEYVCVAAENGVYTWVRRVVESSGGGTGGGSGADGFSPIATVEQTETGATITITDKNGTTTATVRNGAKGNPGDDYILTEADKTEIAEEAADIVDDALSEVIGDPDGTVPAVPGYMALGMTGAAVGMVARIAAVDADGKPTEWEPVEMPEGGGGSGGAGEWITVTDITLTEEVQTVTVTQDINGNPLAIKNEILLLANILPNAAATGGSYFDLKTYNGENDQYGTGTIRNTANIGVPQTGRACILRRYKYHSELNTFLLEEILEAKGTDIDWAKAHALDLFNNFDYHKTKLIIPAAKIEFKAYVNMGVGSRIAIYAR